MTYQTATAISQMVSLLLFLSIFLVVLGYLFWPRNREKIAKRLEQDQRKALDLNIRDGMPGGH